LFPPTIVGGKKERGCFPRIKCGIAMTLENSKKAEEEIRKCQVGTPDTTDMKHLEIDFCGIHLKNPFLLAAGPATAYRDLMVRGLERGWAGAVTKTICQDKDLPRFVANRFACLPLVNSRLDSRLRGNDIKNKYRNDNKERECRQYYGFENIELISDCKASEWFQDLKEIAGEFPDRLLIASIMASGNDKAGWKWLAVECQKSGARMLELNLSCPHGMPEKGMGSVIGQDAELAKQVTQWVAEEVSIPVMVKLTPNVTDISVVAEAVVEGGAQAVSAINTVGCVMGVDLETLSPLPSVKGYSTSGGLSGPAVKPIALKAVSSIAKNVRVPISGMGGIANGWDAAEFMLLGARTVQLCSTVMFRGLGVIQELTDTLVRFMEKHSFRTVDDMVGKSLPKLVEYGKLDAEWRVAAVVNRKTCINCEKCMVSCKEAGFQAISMDAKKYPVIDDKLCTGCGLCVQVCPIFNCIRMVERS
jgi:dihydropyrimidine dehydrogenase (NAD+) subunit PreA